MRKKLRESYLFKQELVQQAEDEDLETRVATIEFAHLDQIAQDLDIETKVNQLKSKSQKTKSVWRQNAANNIQVHNIIRSSLRLFTSTRQRRMRTKRLEWLCALENVFFFLNTQATQSMLTSQVFRCRRLANTNFSKMPNQVCEVKVKNNSENLFNKTNQ